MTRPTQVKFSIITPTILRETLLRTCKSLDHQKYTYWEHIIIVDKAKENLTEKDKEILQSIQYKNRLCYYLDRSYRNYGNTPRHRAFQYVTGDYILYLDDDDYHINETLSILAEHINRMATEPEFGVFPARRYGERFFNLPPARMQTVSCQFFHKPYIQGQAMQWEDKADYTADADLMDRIKSLAPYIIIDVEEPLVSVDISQWGNYAF